MNRIPIATAVRDMLGRDLDPHEQRRLDEACDDAEAAIAGSDLTPHTARGGWTLGRRGTDLIQRFEGCARRLPDGDYAAYPDPGSDDGRPWTIGWGSTGPDIVRGTIWSQVQCDARFAQDMRSYADAVSRAIGSAATTQDQFDALVSFHYNTGAIATATLTKKHIAGDYHGARAEFGRWVRNAGKVMAGLVKRRAAEAQLYLPE